VEIERGGSRQRLSGGDVVEALRADLRFVEERRGVGGTRVARTLVELKRFVRPALHGEDVPEIAEHAVVAGPALQGVAVLALGSREVSAATRRPADREMQEGGCGLASHEGGQPLLARARPRLVLEQGDAVER